MTTVAYQALLRAFLEDRLTADEVEVIFLFMFKNDPGGRDPNSYEALNTFFGYVDAYVTDVALRAQTSDGIGPSELRAAAKVALDQLSG